MGCLQLKLFENFMGGDPTENCNFQMDEVGLLRNKNVSKNFKVLFENVMGSIFVAEITYETSTLINDIFNKISSPPAITSPFTEAPPFFWD